MIENTIELVGELTSTGELVGQVATGTSVGTTNYERLNSKPKINSIELIGDLSLEKLGIQPAGDYLTSENIPTIPTNVSTFNNDAGYLTEVPSGYATEEYVNNATSSIVTSYNDLEDKPFGEEITPCNCIPEGTVITNGNSYYREEGHIGLGGLGVDLKYLVNFNSTEYICETIGVYNYERYIGNPHYLDESLESNEYPFCILDDSYNEVYRIYFDGDADTTAVVSLDELIIDTKQIDPKFIPSEYVTDETLDSKDYATEEYVTNAINEAIGAALEASY